MQRILKTTLSLPVFLTIFLLEMPAIKNKDVVSPECQVTKWDLPVALKTENTKNLPVLVQRVPVTCCENDASCLDERIYGGENNKIADKKALLASIDQSLKYFKSGRATNAYQRYKIPGITQDRVYKSLQRFRQILISTNSAKELHAAIEKEFVFYQSVGKDNQGAVLFTAYYEPLYLASRTPTKEFKYPAYRYPADLQSWTKPHPTRLELEGADGLQGGKGKLKGLELFWFRDRLEPYIIQIQGSARLKLTDGKQTTIGYAGNTAYNYKSLGRLLVDDGKLPLEGLTMPIILDYFQKHPQDLDIYIPRDRSFVFFQETNGRPAQGSISVQLTPERSIATDKSLMPPGALALIRAPFPFVNPQGELEHRTVSRYVLDQDTGGAIKGAGRVDYFLGTGKIAGDRAGVTVSDGQLFYLLLKANK
ncbi:murein transglycosylase A [Anabaena cylindrica FACHB-243]|uniref:peptidoglycan lytic exotransglycosylase n=1 Tax=Anabaena cylindrica (strain ATCC 27899 / PCC 7122) TaxID=272123 RepID=K9ZH57_ANACC|nr:MULTISPECIES: murein transglycosylase A [Anabaena]AFZ58521.1 MltA domain protein [Anabaena cylindrica PCC 7122]MBD2416283.1 murein transglycosylase A [Anabaena cylindrica FACHB-243]MBY5283272.1 murein transglycosylase A [Anabaena sp. CCAP 1446/1C]MBY5307953.1 murein transglycosylase A [Anabaena sp. CCAP 1446/1C]MCM2407338.1 murein transglycosylase A [Anabaena sp. CCAP 1446/1C]